MKHPLLFLAALAGLAACDTGVESRRHALPAETRPLHAQAATPLVPDGPAPTVQETAEPALQWSAGVVRLDPLTRQGDATVKLFGTAGGDPAMNGLYTHIAFAPEGPDEQWRVFRIGDFESWRVLDDKLAGRVILQVRESRLDAATGNPVSEDKKLIVQWTGEQPTAVTVTPAK